MAQEPEPTAKRAELPMRLTRLRVKNFRSIADIDIPLSPLTVLVGPNGSGKSNVVDALRFVRDVFARGLDQAVMDREGMGVIQRWGAAGEGITIGVEVRIGSVEIEAYSGDYGIEVEKETVPTTTVWYEFTIVDTSNSTLEVLGEELIISVEEEGFPSLQVFRLIDSIRGKLGDGIWEGEIGMDVKLLGGHFSANALRMASGLFSYTSPMFDYEEDESIEGAKESYWWLHLHNAVEQFQGLLNEPLFYTLIPVDLRQPQQTLKEAPFDEKGRNLAAVLRRFSRTGGSSWDNLLFALRQAVMGFETLAVEPVGGYLATKLIYYADDHQFRTSYLGQESDGTIRMIGLLAALLQEPSKPFICIEEPEANIHPGALAVLAGVIDEASLRSQILVTTHSPDMLDHLPVESFLVVEKVGDTTHVGPLDASQIVSVRKRLFTPGELFRMEGLQRQAESAS